MQGARVRHGLDLGQDRQNASDCKTGMVLVGAHVPREMRDRLAATARRAGVSTSALLRSFVYEAVAAAPQAPPSAGASTKLNLRLREWARVQLVRQAAERGVRPAAWATALLEAAIAGIGLDGITTSPSFIRPGVRVLFASPRRARAKS